MIFHDRRDAGRALAQLVVTLPDLHNAIILGLPRGGVPVAYEVALTCNLPLDILTVRKLGAPGQPELAIGAVASGGIVALNARVIAAFHLSEAQLRPMIDAQIEEIRRCEDAYRAGLPPLSIEGRTVILVDDGLATGASMRAAAQAVRPRAGRLILAVPVGALSTCQALEQEADRIVCVVTPPYFEAVGQYYSNFQPTTDEEVRGLLRDARRSAPQFPDIPMSG
jgi:putative phosphoribosyl transferase